MNEERKTLEQREQMTDLERSASFGVARAGGGNFENLGGRLFGCPVVAFRVAIKGHSACERERAAGQERVSARTAKEYLDHVALRIFAVNPIWVSKQLRSIEVAVTPEGTTVDWPQTGSPHR